jgi:hypothetical protein
VLREQNTPWLVSSRKANEVNSMLDFSLTLTLYAALDIIAVKRQEYQGKILFTAPVPLLAFLFAPFAQLYMENIMGTCLDNQPTGPTFEESFKFKDAYIMFTHFGKAANDWFIRIHGTHPQYGHRLPREDEVRGPLHPYSLW